MHTLKSIVSCDLGTQSHDPLGCKCVNIDQANPRPKVCMHRCAHAYVTNPIIQVKTFYKF